MYRAAWFLSAAFAAVVAAPPPAQSELVVNPGFEADDASAGPVLAPSGWAATGNAGADNANPNSGANDGFIGTGALSQVIPTLAGTSYTISFFVDVTDATLAFDPNATFDALFDGVDLIAGPAAASTFFGGYTQFTADVTAVDGGAVLEFHGVTTIGDGTFYIDDVSVLADTGIPADAPEPGSMVLLATALGGLRLVRRRP